MEQIMEANEQQPENGHAHPYSPLRDDHIRVLHIDPGSESPIHCRLEHRPFRWEDEFNPYMTLSYAWGKTSEDDSHLTEKIICDGVALLVTANLEQALKHIRRKLDSRELTRNIYVDPKSEARPPIWVDAVCINQKDPAERNHQVQQMAEIYSNSSRLIVWLGTPERSYSLATMLMGKSWDIVPYSAYAELIQAAWFQRRWVIQEYGLTPYHSRFLLYGDHLDLAGDLRDRIGHNLRSLKLDTGPLTYDTFGVDPCESLLHNLHRFDTAACSNPHDLVYSLLSLSRASHETASITVDYTMPIVDVYRQTAESILRADTRVERLTPLLALATTKPRTRPGRIAWVPDWRDRSTYHCAEHEHAVQFLFFLIGSERQSLGSLKGRIRRTAAHQLTRDGGRDPHSAANLRIVGGRWLRVRGKFLAPCFPPAHKPCGILFGESGEEVRVECWTCEMLAGAWSGLSDEAKALVTDSENRLFVLPYTSIIFVLREVMSGDETSGGSTQRFDLVSCIDPETWRKLSWGDKMPNVISLEEWMAMFTDEDEIWLG